MEEIEYNGKIYYRNQGKWYERSTHIEECKTKQYELNNFYNQHINLENKKYSELIALADEYKKSYSYDMAIKLYNKAIEKSKDVENIKYILPRITSCYRKKGQAEKAIILYSDVKKKYGEEIINAVMLTSIAAAYCDINQTGNAKKCADFAYKLLNGKVSEELKLVYKRIGTII